MGAPANPLQGVMRLARMFGVGTLTQIVPVEVLSRALRSSSQASGGSSWVHLPVELASRGVSRTGEVGTKGEGGREGEGEGEGVGEGGRVCKEEGERPAQEQAGGDDARGEGTLGKRKRDREGLGPGPESDEEEVDSVSCARTQGTPPAVLREKKSPQAGPRTTRGHC